MPGLDAKPLSHLLPALGPSLQPTPRTLPGCWPYQWSHQQPAHSWSWSAPSPILCCQSRHCEQKSDARTLALPCQGSAAQKQNQRRLALQPRDQPRISLSLNHPYAWASRECGSRTKAIQNNLLQALYFSENPCTLLKCHTDMPQFVQYMLMTKTLQNKPSPLSRETTTFFAEFIISKLSKLALEGEVSTSTAVL